MIDCLCYLHGLAKGILFLLQSAQHKCHFCISVCTFQLPSLQQLLLLLTRSCMIKPVCFISASTAASADCSLSSLICLSANIQMQQCPHLLLFALWFVMSLFTQVTLCQKTHTHSCNTCLRCVAWPLWAPPPSPQCSPNNRPLLRSLCLSRRGGLSLWSCPCLPVRRIYRPIWRLPIPTVVSAMSTSSVERSCGSMCMTATSPASCACATAHTLISTLLMT